MLRIHRAADGGPVTLIGHSVSATIGLLAAVSHPERFDRATLEGVLDAIDADFAGWARATFGSDHRDEVARLRVPSLLLQCREDPVAPETVGRWMHVRMPHDTMVQPEARGHCPHVSAPDETVAAIRAFLD